MPPQTLPPGETLEVRSEDGSALEVRTNPSHPDTCWITAPGDIVPPDPVSHICRIAVFQKSTGQIAVRNSLSGGYAEEMIPAPDPSGEQLVFDGDIWSFRGGYWKSTTAATAVWGGTGDVPLGGDWGAGEAPAYARIDNRSYGNGWVFRFETGYTPEYWLGGEADQTPIAGPWGEGPTPSFVGMVIPAAGQIWINSAPHGGEFRIDGISQPGDRFIGAQVSTAAACGLIRVRAGEWSVWADINAINPNHPGMTFSYGAPGDTPLAGNF